MSIEPDNSYGTPSQDFTIEALEELSAITKTYQESLREEFEIAAKDGDPQLLMDIAHKKLALAFPKAIERIVNLMDFAEKDNTQFAAAKFIYTEVKAALAGEENSPLAQLLAKMTIEAHDNVPN